LSPLLPPPPPVSRSPWQWLYAAALAARRRRLGARARRLPVPVVSVGNLHWGGGGKTPTTIAVATRLRDRGRSVTVLSRGYGRSTRGPLVVSRGSGPEVAVGDAGDEPHLIARRLPGVAVVVGESRFEAGELALGTLEPRPDLFLLDDGFAHVRLARDLDLLLFPAADPWAGGRLAPSGRLREPLSAAAGADAVLLTGVEAGASGAGGGAELAGKLSPFGYSGPGFAAVSVAAAVRMPDGRALGPGSSVYAVAAIARPEPFFDALERAGLDVVGRRSFRDHHPYPESDVRALEATARELGAETVVTTEKDAAKLADRLRCPLAVLPIEARPEPAFWEWLDARVEGFGR